MGESSILKQIRILCLIKKREGPVFSALIIQNVKLTDDEYDVTNYSC